MTRSAVPKNPLQIKEEPERRKPTEAELQEVAAMLQALYSPRSRWRRNPNPWRR